MLSYFYAVVGLLLSRVRHMWLMEVTQLIRD